MPTLTPVERISMPAYPELRARYLDRNVPVIVTDMASDWPALTRWSPEFFKRNFGGREVAVTDKSYQVHGANYLTPFSKMSFSEYLEAIQSGNNDLRLFLFELFKFAPELRADIELPAWAGLLSRVFLVSFFGGAGGASTFHYDVDLAHVFHTVIYGSKTFYLFGPDQSAHLYRHPLTVRSYIDVRDPDLTRFPRFASACGHQCELNKGETLVIPSGHWHQAVYSTASWGLSFRQYEAKHLAGGITNMLVREPIDRVLARVLPERWFAYKERTARSRST
jgi:Cupin-like domain